MEACTLADSSGTSVPYGLVDGVLLHHAAIAAHEFGLYGALAAAPLTRGAAATLLGLSERVVAHLVGAAEAFGLVSSDGGVLSLTPVGRAFTIGPDGGPSAFLEFGSVAFREAYGYESVLSRLATDGPGHDPFQGDWFGFGPERFAALMHEHALPVAPLWPALVNLNAHRVLLDVGGGSGTHSVAAVESAPGLSAVILEVHSMARCAERAVAERGLKERIRVVAGDMFHGDWPEADLHLLADVLHDWRPETARGLVRKSFAALPPGGRLALLEMPLAEGDGPLPEVLASSLAMLLTVGGQQYTLAELKGFLSGAGFTRLEAHSVDGLWSLVTGRKP